MCNENYTIGILTYNHEEFILDLLESIRFQIENYGEGTRVSLIVSDDASKDDTVKIVKKWISVYSQLFYQTVVIEADRNQGTASNFHTVMCRMRSRKGKLIAGDDVFSFENIFTAMGKNGHQIKSYTPYTLENGVVQLDKIWYARHLGKVGKKRSNRYHRVRQEIGSYFYTPCTFYDLRMYKKYYKGMQTPYRLFEDDPFFYAILEKDKKAELAFADECMVLYRIHSEGVSTSSVSSGSRQFMQDFFQFKKYVAGKEKNVFVKAYLYMMAQNQKNKYLYVPNYINKLSEIYRKCQIHISFFYKYSYQKAAAKITKLQRYYDYIHGEAEKFKKKYLTVS